MEGEPLDNNVYISLSAARSRFGDVLVRRTAGSIEVEKVELHQLTTQMQDVAAVEAADPQIYGDDIIVVDKSKVKSMYRALIESLPIVNMFGIY